MLDADGDDALQAKCEAVAGKSGGSGVDMLGVTPMFVEVTISVYSRAVTEILRSLQSACILSY